MPRIADILRFSGSLLGHLDGLGQPVLDDQVLATALHGAGLRDWFVLFDSELSQLWDRRRKWASFDEFLTLNRHVERLLWSFGLFSWRADDGQIQIRVPLAPDMAKLVGWRPRMRFIAHLDIGRHKASFCAACKAVPSPAAIQMMGVNLHCSSGTVKVYLRSDS